MTAQPTAVAIKGTASLTAVTTSVARMNPAHAVIAPTRAGVEVGVPTALPVIVEEVGRLHRVDRVSK